MTNEAFEALLENRIQACRYILTTKAKEYAGPTDRLWNFKRSAAILGCTPEEACIGFLTKHLTSIFDMVQSGEWHATPQWDEKIGDAINYLILLEALVKETK